MNFDMRLGFPGSGRSTPVRYGHRATWARLGDLVDETASAPSIADARAAAAAWTEKHLGTSATFIARLEEGIDIAYSRNTDQSIVERLFANGERYLADIEHITGRIFAENGSVAWVLEDAAAKSRLTEEILLATGATVGVMTVARIRKRPMLRAFFGHERVFEEERAIIMASLRILAMAELAHEPPSVDVPFLAPTKRKEELTTREREVLEYLALGYTNAEIALACGNAKNTVKHQVASIFEKLGASTRAEAVRLAILEGHVARVART
jgi:DNA-binding CsgD family transcriptional regulator